MLDEINWNVILPLLLVQLVLIITALTDCIRSQRTKGPKLMWIAVILFIGILGPVLYFVIGRRND